MVANNGLQAVATEGLPLAFVESDSSIRREVEEVKEAVHGVIEEAPLPDKVESLQVLIAEISVEVESWRNEHKGPYMETLEALKIQVDEVHQEWTTVASTLYIQREKLETLLESFPSAIETSAVRGISLRVTHLEQLVSELLEESRAKSTARGARIQLNVSLVTLGVTIVLWGVWIVIGLIR
jgi:hypothetical protein